MQLQAPMVHMNGTAQETLIEQLQATGLAIQDAIQRLSDGCPNRRDYPLGEEAWELVCKQHRSRRERLSSVLDELQDIAEKIADQDDNRKHI